MSSTTHSTPSASPSNPPSNNDGDGRTNIVGIVLGIAGLFIVGIIIYTTWRLKRRRSANLADDSFNGTQKHGTALDRAHPAARITPFGAPEGETPRFKHTPGADMRIAVRRPDGAWQFSDPRTPFTPTGVSDLDVLPSPSSSTTMLPSRAVHKKELEVKASRDARKGYERDYDPDLNPPPPAYGYECGGYINHAKI